MGERALHANIKKRLINNEPFAYAHLIKFERPYKVTKTSTLGSTSANRYGYLTDASFNISFDDGTTNVLGTSNGSQIYYADKVTNVGGFQESTDPKATGMTLTVAAESLYNSVTRTDITMANSGSTITVPNTNLIEEGFREGDKILISGGTNSGKTCVITGIKTNGTVLVVNKVLRPETASDNTSTYTHDPHVFRSSTITDQSSGTSITLKIDSDELKGPLIEVDNKVSLRSYYNRSVHVYKVFLDPDDNSIIGAPVLIFKGLINKADIIDNPNRSLQVKWNITSHWGDFVQVNGRLTSDPVHRALDNEGNPQPEVTKKEAYAWDMGFAHAEDTVNILATYKHSEQVTRYKTKKKWFKTKLKTYEETVVTDRDVNLNFSLSAKYIPVVYGIDKVAGRPIFVDTKFGDPDNVYIADMICEGEIGGIYDIYIDGQPSICFNKEDFDERNLTNGTAKEDASVVCRGRADLGQTIGGAQISGSGVTGSTETEWDFDDVYNSSSYGGDAFRMRRGDKSPVRDRRYSTTNRGLASTTTTADAEGLIDLETYKFDEPNEIYGTVHAGKSDQMADDLLLNIQASPGFKRGKDYYSGGEVYFSPNHKMLDTAYVVNNIKIDQDSTEIPEMEYVVRGKLIDCHNYDYSYNHTPNNLDSSSGESANNFAVGDSVTLYKTSDDSVLNADVFIIDKWAMVGPDGVSETRFRYSDAPDLGYTDGIPTTKQFYMKKGSNTWHMWTSDITIVSGTVATKLEITTTSTTSPSDAPPTYTFASSTLADLILGNTTVVNTFDDLFYAGQTDGQIANNDYSFTIYDQLPLTITQPSGSGTPWVATGLTGTTGTGSSEDQTVTFIDSNAIKLADSAASTNDAYNGMKIQLFEEDAAGDVTMQERIIQDYDGSGRKATIGTSWDAGNEPMANAGSTYTYKIFLPTGDRRVSINPAIQLMDYMSSKVYGKGLDIDDDLSKSDWLSAARTCDTRGTQTLTINSGSATAGDRYVLTSDGTASGTILSMGRVQATVSSATEVIMEECFGSFVKDFMKSSHTYSVGDIVWTKSGYYRCTTSNTYAAEPTGTNPTGWTGPITSGVPIYKIEQTGSANTKSTNITATALNMRYTYNNDAGTAVYENPVTHSLYDMSWVKYWRYLGWEQHHQRWVTRHQTCGTIDTSAPILDTVGGFLEHMNGSLTFESGKYVLRIATTTDSIASDIATASDTGYTKGSELNVRWITEDDIIGNINLKDGGVSKAYNTVNSQIEMPSTQWKGKSVSFYDSNYLKSDKMIVKQGTLNQPSVINYFNARINVENFLRKSRFGLSITFTMGPKALLLKAGETIKITHDKFGWTGKVFRIDNINFNVDCTASVTCREYDDSFYSIDPPRLPSILNEDFRAPIEASPATPSSLAASAGQVGSINLTWTKASGITPNNETEIWVNSSNSQYGAILATVKGDVESFQHNIGLDGAQRYYWIRHKKTIYKKGIQKILYGAYHGSANATTVIPSSLYDVVLQADSYNFRANSSGTISAPNNITFTTQRHNLSAAQVVTTSPSVTLTGSGDTRVLSKANMGTETAVTVTSTVTSTSAERDAGAANTYTSSVTIIRTDEGADGSPGSPGSPGSAGAAGPKTATGQIFYNTEQANAPSAPSNTSVAFNFATGAMTGGVMGTGSSEWSVTPPTASAGATTSKIWYVYYSVTESSAGSGTGQPTFDSTVKQGTGFTNLVTFSSGNFQQNGSNITTIDGGNITTGTIAAARIGAGSFTTTGGSVGGWTINSTSIYTGTEDHSGYTANTGDVTLYSDGTDSSFHAYQFYIDTGGNAYFKGDLTGSSGTFSGTLQVGGTSLTTSNTFNDQTNWSDVAGTPNAPANNATNTNAPESANHSSGSVGGWTISASKIYSTYVEIDNTNHRILIKDS